MSKTLRLRTSILKAAVAPHDLVDVLESLVDSGAIEGCSLGDEEVIVWGDLTSLEALVMSREAEEADRLSQVEPDFQSGVDYFDIAQQFVHSDAFYRLPKIQREVWRLHAGGSSNTEIAATLGRSISRVKTAIRHTRIRAGLPAVSSHTGHGAQSDPAPLCIEAPCDRLGRSRGMCMMHYRRARKSGRISLLKP